MTIYEDANRPYTYYVVEASAEASFTEYMRCMGAALYKVRFAVSPDIAHVVFANNEYGFEIVR